MQAYAAGFAPWCAVIPKGRLPAAAAKARNIRSAAHHRDGRGFT